jgi:hypothetical protein
MITQIGKTSTRGQIIEVLTEEFPLTAKKIYNKMKISGSGVTYHAVYDRISELMKEGVLKKVELQYMIDPKWVEKIGNSINKIRINYSAIIDKKLSGANISSSTTLTFKSFRKQIEYIRKYKHDLLEEMEEGEKLEMYWISDHMLSALIDPTDFGMFTKKIKASSEMHMLVRGKSPLDKTIMKLLSESGNTKIKIGIKDDIGINAGIYNKTVLLFVHPKEIVTGIEKIFKKTKSFEKLNISKINKLIDKKMNSHIIIINEPELADYLSNHIKSFFKK